MPSDSAALVIACTSGAVSLTVAGYAEWTRRRFAVWQHDRAEELEAFKDALVERREEAAKAEEAGQLVARYRDPLLQSAFDLQSRIYNVYRPGGFRGRSDPEYFRHNTLFVFAEFLGWLEILRREMQFLDLGAEDATKELGLRIDRVRDRLASTSTLRDELFIYRGHQRAIGELMMIDLVGEGSQSRRRECMGYAAFVAAQERADFAQWFPRLGDAVAKLPDQQSKPQRLVEMQWALIDLINLLDPDCVRFPAERRHRLENT